MNFFDEVKRLCKQQNLTVEYVVTKALGAGAIDMYYGWKRRNSLPRIDDAYSIAKVLGVSVDYFMSDDKADLIPGRYKEICEILENFSDKEIEQIKIMLKTMQKTKMKM